MANELAERIEELSCCVTKFALCQTDANKKKLLELQDRLTKIQLVAIVKDLNSEHDDYQAALNGLNDAITYIDEAPQKIEHVAKGIKLIAKATRLTEKIIKAAKTV